MSADGSLARVADELQLALPNSLRVSAQRRRNLDRVGAGADAGRYRAAPTPWPPPRATRSTWTTPATTASTSSARRWATRPAGSQLVLHNLGQGEADAYAGSNRRAGLVVGSGGRHVRLQARRCTAGQHRHAALLRRRHAGHAGLPGQRRRLRAAALQRLRLAGGATGRARVAGGRQSTLLLGRAWPAAARPTARAGQHRPAEPALGLTEPAGSARMAFLQQIAVDNTP
jgi:hypothetical protein